MPDWSQLDAQLAAHAAADAEESGDVAAVRAFLRAHPDDAHLRSQLLGHLTGSAFVLDPARERILLLHHRRLDRWLQPGGHGEGETEPLQIALREVEEETGLAAAQLATLDGRPAAEARLFDVDIHRIPARPGEPEHDHLDLRFAFVAVAGAQARLSSESKGLAWIPLREQPAGADAALLRALGKLRSAPGAGLTEQQSGGWR
jgi:8-oxo-dGTP pyrophosphatase MutT (NUDIX family)